MKLSIKTPKIVMPKMKILKSAIRTSMGKKAPGLKTPKAPAKIKL